MRMLLIPAVLMANAAVPAQAEVTHHFTGRFGVTYSSGQNGAPGTTQPMYEGTYTARFSHQTDTGVRFRFDLGIALSNFDSPRPPSWPPEDERR